VLSNQTITGEGRGTKEEWAHSSRARRYQCYQTSRNHGKRMAKRTKGMSGKEDANPNSKRLQRN